MTISSVKLFKPQMLSTNTTLYYKTPSLTKTIIKKISFTNTSSNVVEVFLYLIESGDSESDSNLILRKKIAAGDFYDFYGMSNDVLESGDEIKARASIAESVNVRGSGAEIVKS